MQLDVAGFGQLTYFLTGFSFAYSVRNEIDDIIYIYIIMMSADALGKSTLNAAKAEAKLSL